MNTAEKIKKETQKMNFNQATKYIESIGLDIEIHENYPFLKSWRIKNHNEFTNISNYLNSLDSDKSDIKFTFKF